MAVCSKYPSWRFRRRRGASIAQSVERSPLRQASFLLSRDYAGCLSLFSRVKLHNFVFIFFYYSFFVVLIMRIDEQHYSKRSKKKKEKKETPFVQSQKWRYKSELRSRRIIGTSDLKATEYRDHIIKIIKDNYYTKENEVSDDRLIIPTHNILLRIN